MSFRFQHFSEREDQNVQRKSDYIPWAQDQKLNIVPFQVTEYIERLVSIYKDNPFADYDIVIVYCAAYSFTKNKEFNKNLSQNNLFSEFRQKYRLFDIEHNLFFTFFQNHEKGNDLK